MINNFFLFRLKKFSNPFMTSRKFVLKTLNEWRTSAKSSDTIFHCKLRYWDSKIQKPLKLEISIWFSFYRSLL